MVKWNRLQTVDHLSAQYNASRNFWSTQISGHCLIWDSSANVRLMHLCWANTIANYAYISSENITIASWISENCPSRMNPDSSFITLRAVSGHAIFKMNSCSTIVQQVIPRFFVAILCYKGHSHRRLWDTWIMVECIMKAEDYRNITASQLRPYMASVFQTRNEIFQLDNDLNHKARTVLEWFQKHDVEL